MIPIEHWAYYTQLSSRQALVECVQEGKVRSIGVSNYGVHHLDELEQWQKVRIDSCWDLLQHS
jgi:diketogulonate reductase-like aldo/keto reductase